MGKYLAIYDDELHDLCSEGAKEKNTTKSKYAKAVLREALAIKNSKDGTKNEVSNEGSSLSESDRIYIEGIKEFLEDSFRQCAGATTNLNQITKRFNAFAKNHNHKIDDEEEFNTLFKSVLENIDNVNETYKSVNEQLNKYLKK